MNEATSTWSTPRSRPRLESQGADSAAPSGGRARRSRGRLTPALGQRRDSPRPTITPSFATVAEDHLDDVFSYLLYLTGDRSVAEDLTGETFERALRGWRRYDARRGTAKTWLCQIARSAALDHLRSEARRRKREEAYALESADASAGRELGAQFSPELAAALAALSAGEREVIALRVVLDVDGDSAARLLGISPTACSTRLSRALKRLQEKVGGDDRV